MLDLDKFHVDEATWSKKRGTCKRCVCVSAKGYRDTIIGSIKTSVNAAKYCAKKRRNKKCRYDTSGEFVLNFQDIVDLIHLQGARCMLSGIPMDFVTHSPYQISIARIDDNKGYTKENIVMVIAVLNSGWGRWNKKEFEYF
jgi:hypothetical protein